MGKGLLPKQRLGVGRAGERDFSSNYTPAISLSLWSSHNAQLLPTFPLTTSLPHIEEMQSGIEMEKQTKEYSAARVLDVTFLIFGIIIQPKENDIRGKKSLRAFESD